MGGLPTDPKATASPPMVSVWAGFHECSWNADGQVRMRLDDHVRVEADTLAVDLGAGGGEQLARLRVEEVHPDLGEDPQRRVVDRLQLVGRDDLGRRVAQARLGERPLLGQARALAPGMAPRRRLVAASVIDCDGTSLVFDA